MSALAKITKEKGHNVWGSDIHKSKITDGLVSAGIKVNIGHSAENIKQADIAVFSAAISEDNEELLYAKNNGIPLLTRAEYLGLICTFYKNVIAISGMHGKTTTTAMTSTILLRAGFNPTIHVGGEYNLIGGNMHMGGGQYIVTEACEYKDSFLELLPTISVITNIEEEHLDYFKNLKNIQKSFNKFIKNTKDVCFINDEYVGLVRQPSITHPAPAGHPSILEGNFPCRCRSLSKVQLTKQQSRHVKHPATDAAPSSLRGEFSNTDIEMNDQSQGEFSNTGVEGADRLQVDAGEAPRHCECRPAQTGKRSNPKIMVEVASSACHCGRADYLLGEQSAASAEPGGVVTFGIGRGQIQARNVRLQRGGSYRFAVYKGENYLTDIKLKTKGRYNVNNALAAAAVCEYLGVSPQIIKNSLEDYRNVDRRFEMLGELGGNIIMHDYAHHPTEIKNALLTAKETYSRPVVGVFQPHTYTRTKTLLNKFLTCFDDCSLIYIIDTYAAREPYDYLGSSEYLALKLKETKNNVQGSFSFEQFIKEYEKAGIKNSVIMFLGAGDIKEYLNRINI